VRGRGALAAECTRGGEALESAEILLAAGKLADAVSRAYYAAFHFARTFVAAARALLERDGWG
jgi:uncharacterized protein (UPF0332 family)